MLCERKVKISYDKLLTTVVQMIYRYLSKFSTLFYGTSYYFSEILTEVAVGRKIGRWLYWNLWKKWWKMSVVVRSFNNDESTRPPTLLKTEYTTDILIDQAKKLQSSCFEEYLWKTATVLQKACILRACSEISFKKHFHWNSTKQWIHQSSLSV